MTLNDSAKLIFPTDKLLTSQLFRKSINFSVLFKISLSLTIIEKSFSKIFEKDSLKPPLAIKEFIDGFNLLKSEIKSLTFIILLLIISI